MKAPCLHCSRREVGCHGRCEAYREFRRDVEVRRAYEKKYCTCPDTITTCYGVRFL